MGQVGGNVASDQLDLVKKGRKKGLALADDQLDLVKKGRKKGLGLANDELNLVKEQRKKGLELASKILDPTIVEDDVQVGAAMGGGDDNMKKYSGDYMKQAGADKWVNGQGKGSMGTDTDYSNGFGGKTESDVSPTSKNVKKGKKKVKPAVEDVTKAEEEKETEGVEKTANGTPTAGGSDNEKYKKKYAVDYVKKSGADKFVNDDVKGWLGPDADYMKQVHSIMSKRAKKVQEGKQKEMKKPLEASGQATKTSAEEKE